MLVFLLLVIPVLSQGTIDLASGYADGDEANDIATTIGIIIGCVVWFILLLILLYLCFQEKINDETAGRFACCKSKNTLKRYRQNYYRLIQQHNGSDFEIKMGGFEYMLESMVMGRKRFVFTENNQQYEAKLHSVKSKKKSPFLLQLILAGEDSFGLWKGEGAFMNSSMGPLFWMLKDYKDKEKSGQVKQWEVLMFESTAIRDGSCQGRWFFEGMQESPQFSGKWQMG